MYQGQIDGVRSRRRKTFKTFPIRPAAIRSSRKSRWCFRCTTTSTARSGRTTRTITRCAGSMCDRKVGNVRPVLLRSAATKLNFNSYGIVTDRRTRVDVRLPARGDRALRSDNTFKSDPDADATRAPAARARRRPYRHVLVHRIRCEPARHVRYGRRQRDDQRVSDADGRWTHPTTSCPTRTATCGPARWSTDRISRLDPATGKVVEWQLPTETNIRRVWVDNSTNPVTFWTGSNHGAAIYKLEPSP